MFKSSEVNPIRNKGGNSYYEKLCSGPYLIGKRHPGPLCSFEPSKPQITFWNHTNRKEKKEEKRKINTSEAFKNTECASNNKRRKETLQWPLWDYFRLGLLLFISAVSWELLHNKVLKGIKFGSFDLYKEEIPINISEILAMAGTKIIDSIPISLCLLNFRYKGDYTKQIIYTKQIVQTYWILDMKLTE